MNRALWFFLLLLVPRLALAQAEELPPEVNPRSIEDVLNEEVEEVQGGSEAKKDALAEKERRKIVEKLLEELNSTDQNKAFLAALALKRYVTRYDIPLLAKTVRVQTEDFPQIAILDALTTLDDPQVIETVRFVGNRATPAVQLATIEALGKLRSEFGFPLLMHVLLNTDVLELRKRAASALAMIGGPQARGNIDHALAVLPTGGPKRAALWARAVLDGKIDEAQIDTDFREGSKQALLYRGMLYYYYHPTQSRTDETKPWLLVCVHSEQLDAEEMFDTCYPIAKKYRLALVVPLFDDLRFPQYRTFNVRGERADKRLLSLVAHVAEHGKVRAKEVYLFGVGHGGEFVQRFLMAYPDRIARAAFFAYEFVEPNAEHYYPTGLLESPLAPDLKFDLRPVIKTDFAILVNKTMGNRREANKFYNGLSAFAEAEGVTSRIVLKETDDGVSNGIMWNAAYPFLFPRM